MGSYKEKEKQEENQDDDHDESLKTRISSHPLYGLLVETHLDCLKVGGIVNDLEESDALKNYMKLLDNQKSSTLGESELDHFMEAYCLALRKLKEAMEEPHQKSMTFITNMHHQLMELTPTRSHLDLPEPPASFHHRRHTSGQS
ncbi:homeobox protein knotted-1-like 1 [Argentina anserina]|uniref:homeobox protein knotted-1-like 1 n=1 Tax=Argentina anserina TaxID=57926 RepID=UPI0021762219|nr:homeobox protein knotted-1-like 1 [Potentilla anserina]